MKKPQVHAVAAIGKNPAGRWVIGRGNELIWHISDDLKRFKELTAGHPIIMGRKTFASIGKPLPNRANIVITRDPEWTYEGVHVVHSPEDAYTLAASLDQEKVYVIGGGEIYVQMLPYTDVLNLTIVNDTQDGDVFFPMFEKLYTKEIAREERVTPAGLKYTWVDITRN